MKILLLADLHLTDKSSEEYRWGVFNWIMELVRTYKLENIIILGDITDSKDKHSAVLVNRMVDELSRITYLSVNIYIVMGNHDYIDPNTPFFGFLNRIQRINFVSKTSGFFLKETYFYLIPNNGMSLNNRKDIDLENMYSADYVFIHETINQAVGSNGFKLPGLKPEFFKDCKGKVYSGDIHVPQFIDPIRYVGAPYSIKFGDEYAGGGIIIDTERGGTDLDVFYDSPMRLSIKVKDSSELLGLYNIGNLREGDHLKVKVQLPRGRIQDWGFHRDEIKAFCANKGIELFGIALEEIKRVKLKKKGESKVVNSGTPDSILKEYAKRESIGDEVITAGLSLLGEK